MKKLRIRDYLTRNARAHYARATFDARRSSAPHTHDFFEVFWSSGGEGVHRVNGEDRVLQPRTLVLIRPTDVHSFAAGPRGALVITNVAFATATWRYLARRYLLGRRDPFSEAEVAKRHVELDSSAWHALEMMSDDLRRGRADRLAVERFLVNLMALLEGREERGAKAALPAWLARAFESLRRREGWSRGLAGFLETCDRSPEHAARQSRRYLGRSPTELVNDARLEWAAERLRTSRDKIVVVAAEAGLRNLGHFHKLFKTRFGIPPRQYRILQEQLVRGE